MYLVECVYTEPVKRSRAPARRQRTVKDEIPSPRKRANRTTAPLMHFTNDPSASSSLVPQGLVAPAAQNNHGLFAPLGMGFTSTSSSVNLAPCWLTERLSTGGPIPQQEKPGNTWSLSGLNTYVSKASKDLHVNSNSTSYSSAPDILGARQAAASYPRHTQSSNSATSAGLSAVVESPGADKLYSVCNEEDTRVNNHTVYSAGSTLAVCLEECRASSTSLDGLSKHWSLFDGGQMNDSSAPSPIPGLQADLPDVGVAADGIHAYFENVHPIYPFMDLRSFLDNWPALYAESFLPDSIFYSAFCLVVAIGLSSDASDQRVRDRQETVMGLYRKTSCLLNDVVGTPIITSVQVLVLHVILHIQLGKEDIAWIICGLANRMSQSLGLHHHQGPVIAKSPEELFSYNHYLGGTIFSLDAFLSALECKPTSVSDIMWATSPLSLGIQASSANTNITTVDDLFRWTVQLARVRNCYCESIKRPQTVHSQVASLLQVDIALSQWLEEVPLNMRPGQGMATLSPQPLYRFIAMLHLDYYFALCSIHWALTQFTKEKPECRLVHSTIRMQSCEDICLSAARSFVDILNGIANTYEGSRLFSITFYSQSCIMVLAILYRAVVCHPQRITAKGDLESFRAGKIHLGRHAHPSKLSPALRALFEDMLTSAEDILARAQA
ncbi:hypothetical protein BJX63DRAFT_437971 [Aspergillus granulosus]|uniref:Xylanolytic transcriptional activator regulatory domain-containing protein n=1 Tax=Aspergillus granulosus TaxID=176169 RepID=A0ABR4GTC0_9EURO